MDVLLFGASGRIGHCITHELLDRGHVVTGVSRSGIIDDLHDPSFRSVAGDATDSETVAQLADGRDLVASALGPDPEKLEALPEMAQALVEGMRAARVRRLVWTGGAGGLRVGPDTRLLETEDVPEDLTPIARVHIHALEILREAEDIDWSYVAPPAVIEPGTRTGQYRTAEGSLVVDEEGESYISMEDFAVAFVDEIEEGNAIHVQLGVGY